MTIVELTPVRATELEEWLSGEAAPRLQCELIGVTGAVVAEPRITPWLGFMVDHQWQWLDAGPWVLDATRLTLLGESGYDSFRIDQTPFQERAYVVADTRSVTIIQKVGYPVLLS